MSATAGAGVGVVGDDETDFGKKKHGAHFKFGTVNGRPKGWKSYVEGKS